MEIALLGPKVTYVRYVVTFIFPLVVGLIANAFFPSWGDKVREQVKLLQSAGEKS